MKYLLLIYSPESAWTEEERAACMARSRELCHELAARNQYLGAAPLHPVNSATCVKGSADKPLITDGPFAETHEQLGGYFLIDVPDLNAAIAVARRLPTLGKGSIEIRPVVELPDMPEA